MHRQWIRPLLWALAASAIALALALIGPSLATQFDRVQDGGWLDPPEHAAAACSYFAIVVRSNSLVTRTECNWGDPGLELSLFGDWPEQDPEPLLKRSDPRANPLLRSPPVPPRGHRLLLIEAGWPLRCLVACLEASSARDSPNQWQWDRRVVFPNTTDPNDLGRYPHLVNAVPVEVRWLELGLNTLAATAALGAIHLLLQLFVRHRRYSHGACPHCAHDLRGDLRAACPECGATPCRLARPSQLRPNGSA